MKKILSAITFGVCILVPVGGMFFFMKSPSAQKAPLQVQVRNPQQSPALLKKAEEKREEVLNFLANQVSSSAAVSSEQRPERVRLQAAFEKLLENIDFFDRDNLEKSVFSVLASDARHITLAIETVTNHSKAQSDFGERQAEMRAYAIKFLGHLAANGDKAPLENVISSLQEKLVREGETYRGQILDLEDSLISLCQNENSENAIEDLEQIFSRFNLAEKDDMSRHETATLEAFIRGVSLGFKGKIPSDSLNSLFLNRFPQFLQKG